MGGSPIKLMAMGWDDALKIIIKFNMISKAMEFKQNSNR